MNKIMKGNIQELRRDADILEHLSNSLNQAADIIAILTEEYEKQIPLKESYMKLAALALDYLCEKNMSGLYGETCSEIRHLGFVPCRNGYNKHEIKQED